MSTSNARLDERFTNSSFAANVHSRTLRVATTACKTAHRKGGILVRPLAFRLRMRLIAAALAAVAAIFSPSIAYAAVSSPVTPTTPVVSFQQISSSDNGPSTVIPDNKATAECPFVEGSGCTVEWTMGRGVERTIPLYIAAGTGKFTCEASFKGSCNAATCTERAKAYGEPKVYPDTWTIIGNNVSIISVGP